MAVSAFKSATRRGAAAAATPSSSAGREPPTQEKKPAPPRRSRSVSAFSRRSEVPDFSYKRDNPLFCSGDASPSEVNGAAALSKELIWDKDSSRIEPNRVGGSKSGGGNPGVGSLGDDRRGRTASRSSGKPSEIGRSVSRGRTRSVSQRPVSRGHLVGSSESEVEQETSPLKNYRNRASLNLMRNSIESVDPGQVKTPRTCSSQHPPAERSADPASRSHLEFLKWEDGLSMGSCSEVEEKTIKAVCEQMKSVQGEQTSSTSIYETVRSEVKRAISDIQSDLESAIKRSNATAIAGSDLVDIPPDLVNPGAVELVMDIRSEYAKKLEQSQEHARKLRADLAVEEHRGEELSRILKEILPDPRAPNSQKPRPTRRFQASIERRKMSRRLTEEAMAYFDECVSLSTFDSSDFSSPEDPPLKIVGSNGPIISETASVLEAQSAMSLTSNVNCHFSSNQDISGIMPSPEHSSLRTDDPHCGTSDPGSSSSTNVEGRKCQFSFSSRPTSYSDFQQDIKRYIKNLETDTTADDHIPGSSGKSQYDCDGYHIQASVQTLVFDRVTHKSRVESGGLLLCGDGVASMMFSPFGSTI